MLLGDGKGGAIARYGRVTYPFYIPPARPGWRFGVLLHDRLVPAEDAVVNIVDAFALFFLYFPVKDFLSDFVRVWLGR